MEKLGRNEPCHCGSEKKYKKCCLDEDIERYGKKAIKVTNIMDDKEMSYDKALELYEKERFTETIELLLKVYADDPYDIDVITLLAACYVNIAHFTDAVRLLSNADTIDPKNPMIKYNLGYALLCMGRLNDAMECMNECLRLNPSDEIKEATERMIKSKEYFAERLENNYNISLEEELECEEKFRQAQKYLYTKRFEEAIVLYNTILEKKPGFHQAIQNIGVCYIKSGKHSEALKYFEEALRISPKDELCLGNLAHANYLLGNLEKSRKYSDRVMKVIKKPLLRDLLRLITLFIEIEQFEFARRILTDHCDTYDNIQLTFLSGLLYAKQKDYSAAKEEFQNISRVSMLAKEYLEKVEQLIDGRINEYDFQPKMAIAESKDMI